MTSMKPRRFPTHRWLMSFGLNVSDVTNYLAAARREFRKIVLERLRELTATDESFAQKLARYSGWN